MPYSLSKGMPGMDSIVESILVDQPDFDQSEKLKIEIEKKVLEFINIIASFLNKVDKPAKAFKACRY